ncbi:MAG: DUF4412 domain-containing protein [Candidatus Omnitrophota bacterium]|nr:DUF4412 domain-containing protein [Candidatus Omnitrophota bacterium]
MIKRFICGPLAKLVILGCMLGFSAQVLAAEFSADLIQDGFGQTTKGKVYIKGSKVRMEASREGEESIMISDPTKGTVYVLMPKDKTYLEMSGAMANIKMNQIEADEELTRIADKKYLGTENINGYACDKYDIIYHDKSLGKAVQWHSKKLNFPIKMVYNNSYGSMTVEYKNIKEGKINSSLFEIPPDYQKMTMPGAGQGMGQGAGQGVEY